MGPAPAVAQKERVRTSSLPGETRGGNKGREESAARPNRGPQRPPLSPLPTNLLLPLQIPPSAGRHRPRAPSRGQPDLAGRASPSCWEWAFPIQRPVGLPRGPSQLPPLSLPYAFGCLHPRAALVELPLPNIGSRPEEETMAMGRALTMGLCTSGYGAMVGGLCGHPTDCPPQPCTRLFPPGDLFNLDPSLCL